MTPPSSLTSAVAGSCTVEALQSADAGFNAGKSNPVAIQVGPGAQVPLVLTASPTSISVNGTSALSTHGGSGNGAVTYAVNSGPCTMAGSAPVRGDAAGGCQVVATKAADANYGPATSNPVTVTVNRLAPPALVLTATPAGVGFGGSSTLGTTGGIPGALVAYDVTGPCSVSGNTLIGTSVGDCVITATQAETSLYGAATSGPVTVTVKERTTVFGYPHAIATIGRPFVLTPVTGGFTSPTFALLYGNLPAGLTLDPATGVISGTPTGPAGTVDGVITAYENNCLRRRPRRDRRAGRRRRSRALDARTGRAGGASGAGFSLDATEHGHRGVTRTMSKLRQGSVSVVVTIVAAMVSGCSTARPPSELRTRMNKVTASQAELRLRLRALAPPFAGIVEDAADRMAALSTTPEEKLFATRVKVEAVPALFAALFRPDPTAALADTWVLIAQMRMFFETGRGRLLPPEARAVAAGACDRLYAEIQEEARQVASGGSTAGLETWVKEWAAANPIESLAARPSTASFFARLVAEQPLGAAQTAGKIEEDLADMGARLDFLTATLPKQARWQAERLLLETANTPDARNLLEAARAAGADATRAVTLLDRAIRLLEALPAEAGTQREEVMRALRQEREAIVVSARVEREALQAFASGERQERARRGPR